MDPVYYHMVLNSSTFLKYTNAMQYFGGSLGNTWRSDLCQADNHTFYYEDPVCNCKEAISAYNKDYPKAQSTFIFPFALLNLTFEKRTTPPIPTIHPITVLSAWPGAVISAGTPKTTHPLPICAIVPQLEACIPARTLPLRTPGLTTPPPAKLQYVLFYKDYEKCVLMVCRDIPGIALLATTPATPPLAPQLGHTPLNCSRRPRLLRFLLAVMFP